MVEIDLSELPTEVIRTTLCETVEKKLKSKKYAISVTSASKAGENNFICVVYRVTFNKSDGVENGKEDVHKLILKTAPQNVARREAFISRPCFLREIYVYEKVLPSFRQFQESKGIILEEDGFTEYPECYRCVDVEPSECILLEDLSVRGFSIIDRYTEEVTYDHVRLVMQSLAKFHAISFALKDEQPKKFEELASGLSELFIRTNDENFKKYFTFGMDGVLKMFPNDTELLTKLKKIIDKDVVDTTFSCVDSSLAGSAAVIGHGDAWQNNTMFRCDANKKPIEVSLLDWQISRYASPIIDIVYFMFNCTTKELRDAHYDEFLKIYHDTLSTQIRKLGSDPEQLFPFKLMMEHFRKFGKFGLFMAALLLPMITNESGNGLDLDELSNQMGKEDFSMEDSNWINEKTMDKYHKRMHGVVVDMIRLGYI